MTLRDGRNKMNVKEFIDYLIREISNGSIKEDDEIWCEYSENSAPIENIFRLSEKVIHVSTRY